MKKNIELVCNNADCGIYFMWTVGEQDFLEKLAEEGKIPQVRQPRFCPQCRMDYKIKNNIS